MEIFYARKKIHHKIYNPFWKILRRRWRWRSFICCVRRKSSTHELQHIVLRVTLYTPVWDVARGLGRLIWYSGNVPTHKALFMCSKWSHRILRGLKWRASHFVVLHARHTNDRRSRLLKEMKAFASTKYRIAQSFFFLFFRLLFCTLFFSFSHAWNARATVYRSKQREKYERQSAVVLMRKKNIKTPILIAHTLFHTYFHKKFPRNAVPKRRPTEIGNDTILTACFATSRHSRARARKKSDFNICHGAFGYELALVDFWRWLHARAEHTHTMPTVIGRVRMAVWATDMCAYGFPETWQCLHGFHCDTFRTSYERVYSSEIDEGSKKSTQQISMLRRRCTSTLSSTSSPKWLDVEENETKQNRMDFIVRR